MKNELPLMRTDTIQEAPTRDSTDWHRSLRAISRTALNWQRAALGFIVAVTAYLNFYEIGRLGYSNTYYAAGVKSMMMNWHNFFFVSFDPGGFVTIDKPPLGFWLQVVSAKIFGFHGWSLILPEALAGIGSVVLLYYLVRRVWGDIAGLLAAAAMAIMPVAIATNRSNIVDSVLVFFLLLGAWAVIHATETGRLRWFLVAMVCVGLGFNVKMLEAYLAVPAFFALYFLGARIRWSTKIWHLLLAAVVLVVVSLSWATAVDLTPASQRPYVGSSDDNSEYNLIFGYNGLNRLLSGNWSFLGLHGSGFGRGGGGNQSNAGVRLGFGQGENGAVGPLRLLDSQLGGQASWLLPLALIGILAAGWRFRPRLPLIREHQSIIFWGIWLLTCAVFFSIAGFFHAYYLVTMGPPIAALTGIGLVAMWTDYRSRSWRGWLLPFALVGVALIQRRILRPFPTWSHWMSPTILIVAIAAAIALIVARLLAMLPASRLGRSLTQLGWRAGIVAVGVGVLAVGLAPGTWAMETAWNGGGGLTPSAGPTARAGFGGGRGGFQAPTNQSFDIPGLPGGAAVGGLAGDLNPLTLEYLLNNQGKTKYLLAVSNAMTAAPVILETGKPVMAIGGFSGSDPILTVANLQKLIENGTVRFFMLSGGFGGGGFAPSVSQGSTTPVPGNTGQQGEAGTGQFAPRGGQRGEGEFNGEFRGGFGGDFTRDFGGGSNTIERPTTPAQPSATGGNASESVNAWVTSQCSPVSQATIDGTSTQQSTGQQGGFGRGGSQLYDCAPTNSTTLAP
ncbi:MAG TPA: glycosyltransferase family 39 protein [Nitrolancea sp.]|nr:glycosyltransferase family 39 protein [Nitrolancea sp.]